MCPQQFQFSLPVLYPSTIPYFVPHAFMFKFNPFPDSVPSIYLPLISILFSLVRILGPSLLLTFFGDVYCSMVILHFMANIHLQMILCFSFWVCFTSLNMIFLVPFICKFHDIIVFNTWIILHFIIVPHFLHPFINWGTSKLFLVPDYYKQSSMNTVE